MNMSSVACCANGRNEPTVGDLSLHSKVNILRFETKTSSSPSPNDKDLMPNVLCS